MASLNDLFYIIFSYILCFLQFILWVFLMHKPLINMEYKIKLN